MLPTILVASALVLTTGCAGVLDLGGKDAIEKRKSGKKKKLERDVDPDALPGTSRGDEDQPDEGQTVEASKSDPAGIHQAVHELERMEKALASGDVPDYAQIQQFLYDDLYAPSDEVRESPRYKKLLKWMRALDVRAATMAGGHAPEIMGDGKRFGDVGEDAIKAAEEALFACEQAAKTSSSLSGQDMKELDEAYAEYEKKLARANRVDERATRTMVPTGERKDLAPKFVACEARIAALRMEFEDAATHEERVGGRYKACGYSDWVFVAIGTGGGRFGPFELDGVHTDNGVAYPCKKFPRRGKVPGPVMKAVKRELKVKRGEIMDMEGGYQVQRDGLDLKKYATVRIYSKETEINKNDCGGTDPNVVCEATRSNTARAYNEVTHYAQRAEVHRKAGRSARCKELLEKARASAEEWKRRGEKETTASGKTPRYKTRDGAILSQEKIAAAIEKRGEETDERAIGGWCDGKRDR